MKTTLFTILLAVSAFFMIGCESDDNTVYINDLIPAAPQGVYSVTGDGEVYIYWNGPYEDDLAGYVIYRSFDAVSGYTQIGYVNAVSNPNLDLITYEYIDDAVINGETYFYAVSTIDDGDNESELSAEEVFDTPRPEGFVTLYDMDFDSLQAGLILDTILYIVSSNNPLADIYIDSDANAYYINSAYIGVDIQDMGYTSSFDEIGYAPTEGWSNNGWAELILGHTYVIWDDDLFFAKLRVESFGVGSVNFRWAFQLDPDNPELVQPKHEAEKPAHQNYNAKRPIASNVQ